MQFFPQPDYKSCHLIAIRHVLSFFNQFPSNTELRKQLPRHSFGNLITEIGTFFAKQGIRSTLISNYDNFETKNALLTQTLKEYRQNGTFIDRLPQPSDIKDKPILINVDWYKIGHHEGGPAAHYIVVIKQDNQLILYDGSNYKQPISVEFEEILSASQNINKWHENGMWLFIN